MGDHIILYYLLFVNALVAIMLFTCCLLLVWLAWAGFSMFR